MVYSGGFKAFSCALLVAGCSAIPAVPDDYELPVREIVQYTVCELRAAFLELNKPKYASFGANKWLVAVKLSPKTDRELSGGVGLTGKSTSVSNASFFNNWALGSVGAPGAAVDIKGTRNASITYTMHSKDLITKKTPLVCPVDSPHYHELTKNLDIKDWLARAVIAKNDTVGSLATLDSPSYSGEIFVKFSGNGSFTYNFPFGTDFASLSGNYDMDETLGITLSPDQGNKVILVQTLPTGGNFQDHPPDQVPIPSPVNAQQRLDTVQYQQGIIDAIRNLPH